MKRSDQIDSLVVPLVEHIMADVSSTERFRRELFEHGALSHEDIDASNDDAICLAYKAMKTFEYASLPEAKLMAVIEAYQVAWHIDLPEDLQQGAVCY